MKRKRKRRKDLPLPLPFHEYPYIFIENTAKTFRSEEKTDRSGCEMSVCQQAESFSNAEAFLFLSYYFPRHMFRYQPEKQGAFE